MSKTLSYLEVVAIWFKRCKFNIEGKRASCCYFLLARTYL